MFRRDEYETDLVINLFPRDGWENFKKDFYEPQGKSLQ